jgi:rod shape-determining protein MreC
MKLVWWLATIFAISLVSIFLSEAGAANPIRNLSLTVTSPAQGSLRDVASPVNNFVAGITDRGDLAEENERLRSENEALLVQLAAQQDAQQRISELEDAIGVKESRPEDSLTAASVIAEDTTGLKRLIAIDRGQADGVEEGMVVLSRNGSLIGTIARVFDDFAWVRLITDPDSAVNVQIASPTSAQEVQAGGSPNVVTPDATPPPEASSTRPPQAPAAEEAVRAVLKGDLRQGAFLELVPSDAAVARGDLVITSGHGGNYPRGLLLGSVQEVEGRPQAPFQNAKINPAADLSGLDTVLVVTSFIPARLTDQ